MKNTVVLYGRMLFVMFVSFFTTRLVLQALGVSDYGLINAVGSVAAMFTFVTASVSVGCSRFLSYEMGRKGDNKLNIVFSMSIIMYIGVAGLLFILLETAGLWYMKNKLVCSTGREAAAMIFYQMVIVQTLVSWFSGPYSALIVAYEDMAFYAVLSIADAMMKLMGALCVFFITTPDQLVFYGLLMTLAAVINLCMHIIFVRMKHPSNRFVMCFDMKLFKEMLMFNGWRLIGVFSWTTGNVFVNLLLNSFFGPIVNAARGVAMQIQFGARALNENFVMAMRPQIIKYWAANERDAFYSLLRQSTKVSYFLVFLFVLPLYAEGEYILDIWLKTPPSHALSFSRIILATTLVNSILQPLGCAIQAVGHVSRFEVVGALINGLAWPISWIVLRQGSAPEVVFVVLLVLATITCILQFLIVMKEIGCAVFLFANEVVCRMLAISIIPITVVFCISQLLPFGFWRFLVVSMVSLCLSTASFLVLGLDVHERFHVLSFVKERVKALTSRN